VAAEVEPSEILLQRLLAAHHDEEQRGAAVQPQAGGRGSAAVPQIPIDDLVDLALACLRASDHRQRGGDANYCLIQAWLACGGDSECSAKIPRQKLLKLTEGFGIVVDLPPVDEEDAYSMRGSMSDPAFLSTPSAQLPVGDISFSDFVEIVTASKELLSLAVQHSSGGSSREDLGRSADMLAYSDEERGEFLKSVIALAKLRRMLRRCMANRRRKKAAAAAALTALQPCASRRVSHKQGQQGRGRRHVAGPAAAAQASSTSPRPIARQQRPDDGAKSTIMPYVLHQTPRHQAYAAAFPSSTSLAGASLQSEATQPAISTASSAPVPQLSLFLAAAVNKSMGPLTPLTKILHQFQGKDGTSSFDDDDASAGNHVSVQRGSEVPSSSRYSSILEPLARRNNLQQKLKTLLAEAQDQCKIRQILPRIRAKQHDAVTQVSEEMILRDTQAAAAQQKKAAESQRRGPRELPRLRLLPLPAAVGRGATKKAMRAIL
jgi:hypothetical protein